MSAQPWESLPEWAHIPKLGQAGLYCLVCHWVKEVNVLPPRGRRTVVAADTRQLGQEVGRCRWHPLKPVYHLLRDRT